MFLILITIVFRSLIHTTYPRGVTIDSNGTVYIADRDNNRVQKLTPEGEVLAVIDRKGGGIQLNEPCGVYVDSKNILYVTDLSWVVIQSCMFSTSGRFLGYVGNDGSSFEHPYFITSDQYGKLYISDNNGVSTY